MNNQFEIDRILDEEIINGRSHYLVKWKGYPSTQSTWEPLSNLIDDLNLVHNWKIKNNPKLRIHKRKAQNQGPNRKQNEKQSKYARDIFHKDEFQKRGRIPSLEQSSSQSFLDKSQSSSRQKNQQLYEFYQGQGRQNRKTRNVFMNRKTRRDSRPQQKIQDGDINGFKNIGRITKDGVQSVLWCFDWESEQFCEVLLRDGRKVHMRKDDVKKISAQLLLEYYQKIQKAKL